MSHSCKVPGCKTHITDERLMCIAHWHLVPEKTRRRLHAARESLRVVRVPAIRRQVQALYDKALQDALAAVENAGVLA